MSVIPKMGFLSGFFGGRQETIEYSQAAAEKAAAETDDAEAKVGILANFYHGELRFYTDF